MLAFCNAGFGDPLPDGDFAFIKALGFQGIRQDIPALSDPARVHGLVSNALMHPEFRAIFVVPANDALDLSRDVALAARHFEAADRTIIEVGNELDIKSSGWSSHGAAQTYGGMVAQIYAAVQNVSPLIRVLTAGVSNPSERGLEWLSAALPYVPPQVGVAYHTYRLGFADEALDGFDSRAAEFRALRAVAGTRGLWNTETGWSMAPRKRPFPECLWKGKVRLTADQVGRRLADEIHLNRLHGAKSVCVYQLNDGPTDTDQDRFGLRAYDGTVKASAEYVKRALSV